MAASNQIDSYKIILDLTELQKSTAKYNITVEQFMKMWYDLEPSMKVVLKTDKYECKCRGKCSCS